MLTSQEGRELVTRLRKHLWSLQTAITNLGHAVAEPEDPLYSARDILTDIRTYGQEIAQLAKTNNFEDQPNGGHPRKSHRAATMPHP